MCRDRMLFYLCEQGLLPVMVYPFEVHLASGKRLQVGHSRGCYCLVNGVHCKPHMHVLFYIWVCDELPLSFWFPLSTIQERGPPIFRCGLAAQLSRVPLS